MLQTTFDVDREKVFELMPGQALIVHKNGESRLEQIMPAKELSACSFERIYFSRGSDCDIYQERKRLGEQLTPAIMKAIDGDVDHTVFSYIPNTAEVAYYGMTDGVRKLHGDVRTEKVVWKDIKLRTFISTNTERNDLAAHVYDISYGSLTPNVDNLVVIDDSIVRGTTLKESIFKILDRLHPKKIVMVSSSPQIRYPDYYGIDMARLEEFCAFRATMALIEERGMWQLVNDTYMACKRELQKPKEEIHNCVRAVYAPFTVEEINNKIVEMLRPANMQAPIELVFQSIDTYGCEIYEIRQSNEVMCPACALVVNAVRSRTANLRDCPRLSEHLANCRDMRREPWGYRFTADAHGQGSDRIDAAIAAAMAMWMTEVMPEPVESFAESGGIWTL